MWNCSREICLTAPGLPMTCISQALVLSSSAWSRLFLGIDPKASGGLDVSEGFEWLAIKKTMVENQNGQEKIFGEQIATGYPPRFTHIFPLIFETKDFSKLSEHLRLNRL